MGRLISAILARMNGLGSLWIVCFGLSWAALGCGPTAEKPAVEPESTPNSADVPGRVEPVQTEPQPTGRDSDAVEMEQQSALEQLGTSSAVADAESEATRLTDAQLAQLGIARVVGSDLELLYEPVGLAEREEWLKLPAMLTQFRGWIGDRYPHWRVTEQTEPLVGHVMRDQGLFVQAGLLPEDLADLLHGKDRGNQFWIVEQPTAYYRRHLMLHESMHCVMNQMPHDWPVWYLEGMAELVANHVRSDIGDYKFAVTPDTLQVNGGFGRIELLRAQITAGKFRTLEGVLQLKHEQFYPHKESYGWAWAICYFLSQHPDTAAAFNDLGRIRTEPAFTRRLREILYTDQVGLEDDWANFIATLTPGFDFERNRIHSATSGRPELLPRNESARVKIRVDQGWQRSGVICEAGQTVNISADGKYILDTVPVDWVSEPQGVSIEYLDGRPRGELQMVCVPLAAGNIGADSPFFQPIPVGRDCEWQAERTGELLFRINEAASDWSDNSGSLEVTIKRK